MLDGNGRSLSVSPDGIAREQGRILRDLAVQLGAVRTIETGFALGLSSLFLCEALLMVGGKDAKHVSLDPFQETVFGNAGLRTVEEACVSHLVEFHADDSQLALPRFVSEGRTFDLAFVDGDHHFEGAFVDLYFLSRLIRPGGLIVIDDAWMPAVSLASKYLETNLGWEPLPHLSLARTSWSSRLVGRRARRWAWRMAVLRGPASPRARVWDDFVPFWSSGDGPAR